MSAPVNERGLELRGVDLAYGKSTVCRGLSLRIEAGGVTAFTGPNGSGKSTILRALARVLAPKRGEVRLDGQTIRDYSANAIARRLALLPQSPVAPGDLSVRELVGFGRYPYRHWLGAPDRDADRYIDGAIEAVGLGALAERPISTLSGGQRRRAWIALALAQDTRYVLLDEPTAHLDVAHGLEVMELLRRLESEHDKTLVVVLHDLNLAARYADRIVVVDDGTVVAHDAPAAILTRNLLRDVFHVDARIHIDEVSGAPFCVPIGIAPEHRETPERGRTS